MVTGGLLYAQTGHYRAHQSRYGFRHKVYYACLTLDDLENRKLPRLFSFNRFNLLSIYEKDYGFGDVRGFKERIAALKAEYDLAVADGKTLFITVPKFLGFGFNPVSFFVLYDKEKNTRAVLAEVHNTFGERHQYLCRHSDNRPIKPDDKITAVKNFHVSPFFPIDGHYDFYFDVTADKVDIRINLIKDGENRLTTFLRGKRETFTAATPYKILIRYPFTGFYILFLIHFHAMILWFKKVTFFKKPPPPSRDLTDSG